MVLRPGVVCLCHPLTLGLGVSDLLLFRGLLCILGIFLNAFGVVAHLGHVLGLLLVVLFLFVLGSRCIEILLCVPVQVGLHAPFVRFGEMHHVVLLLFHGQLQQAQAVLFGALIVVHSLARILQRAAEVDVLSHVPRKQVADGANELVG